jgi:hypothetical protein
MYHSRKVEQLGTLKKFKLKMEFQLNSCQYHTKMKALIRSNPNKGDPSKATVLMLPEPG